MKNIITHTNVEQPFDATLFLEFFNFYKVGEQTSMLKLGEPGLTLPHPTTHPCEFLAKLAAAKVDELLTVTVTKSDAVFTFHYEKQEDKRWAYLAGRVELEQEAA